MNTVIDIEITNYCQARCAVCPRTDVSNPANPTPHSWLQLAHTPLASILKRIDSITEYYPEPVVFKFCGEWGDPLMHPDLLEMVQHVHTQGGRSVVNTNAGMRNAEWWDSLRATQCDVVFGIDGTTPEISALYRVGVNGDAALANMHRWFANGGLGQWQYLAFAHNVEDWIPAIDTAHTHSIPLRFIRGNQEQHMKPWTQRHDAAYAAARDYYFKHTWDL